MQDRLLGSISFEKKAFESIDAVIEELKSKEVENLNFYCKQQKVNETLLKLIEDASSTFLLREVTHFIELIIDEGVLDKYNIYIFELWLNQFSEVTDEQNYALRAKIVGKSLPRAEYQEMFPIGMGKVYPGTHIVTAHGSPDIDTIVASFWGYLDAFAARVGDGIHVWNVPGGPPSSFVELKLLFTDVFGDRVFKSLARKRTSLSLSSYDLVTQKGLVKKTPNDQIFEFTHQRLQSSVIIVDDEGRFVGDWRSVDVEGVRHVVNLFNTHLRFLEYFFQVKLISLFTKPDLKRDDFKGVIDKIYKYQFKMFDPSKELTQHQFDHLNDYMKKVLFLSNGIGSSFEEFMQVMEKQEVSDFNDYHSALRELYLDDLFDPEGQIIEDRPLIFARLERVVTSLSLALRKVRTYVDSLSVGFRIKEKVLGHKPTFLGHRSDIVEIKAKMESYPYLTVNYTSPTGDMHPLGVIYSSDLRKGVLGTVSLRDFSNHDETKVPSYLEVISVIDHHKTNLSTATPSRVMVADVQSVNVLVAEMSFRVNDRFSFGAMTLPQVDAQLKILDSEKDTPQILRLKRRLLMRKSNMLCHKTSRVNPEREKLEYLHFLYAIFDDTDLLTKMTITDVKCVTSLLNRLKSLDVSEESEVIAFDDMDESAHNFVKQASKKLLQHKELHSLYNKVYSERERVITEQLDNCSDWNKSPFFEDTKVQNGCARVGQKKVFAKNVPYLKKHSAQVLKSWFDQSTNFEANNPEVDLHMLMISTISSAEELFKGEEVTYDHQDELWVYMPSTDVAIQHLKLFLSSFSKSPNLCLDGLRVEFLGNNEQELSTIFTESFVECEFEFNKFDIPIAIIHYKAGSINSRKSMIAPHLPKPGNS